MDKEIKPFQRNCPINERTADGVSVGRCWFHTGRDGICPRHGDVNEYLKRLPKLTDEREGITLDRSDRGG